MYAKLTTNARDFFEQEYRELFLKLDELDESLDLSIRDGNDKRTARLMRRRDAIKAKIDELDKALLCVFHCYRRCYTDEFFPELDRYEIKPYPDYQNDPEPSDDQLANAWQEDLIYNYRRER